MAADIAVKMMIVQLIELRIAKGIAGNHLLIIGEVAAGEAAIAAATESVGEKGCSGFFGYRPSGRADP